MSTSSASPSMVFTFGIHQSTTPFVFSCEIDTSSTPFRKRALSDPSPSGPTRKKRRLRLSLTTSPLSLPFSTPRAPSQPDRTSIRNRSSNAVFALGPSQRVLPRLSPSVSASLAPSSSSSSCSLLRRAAVLNRVQQRVDAACQRNPNLRWEKEQRREREMLLKERVEMQRMAALKDGAGLLSSVTSTRPVASPAPAATVQYLGPCQRATAARHGVDDCGSPHDGCDVGSVEDGVEEETNAAAAAATLSCCFSNSSSSSIKNSYPTPPPSAVGLSNYDALDSEEHGAEEDEKDDGGVPPQQHQQQSNEAFHHSDEPPVVDEGMRDIFDFLTPPALHQSFLSDFDGEAEAEADRGVGDLSHSPPDSIPVQVPVQIHAHPNNDDNNDGIDADDDPTATNPPQTTPSQCQAPAVATPTPSPAWAPRVWRASLYRCHHYHLHHSHYHYHLRDRHGHGHGQERQHYCAMAAAFVAVPRAH
ncbi:uncharacterized protein IWZ02DRAFT_433866 [Phyllosticta citriasiana]|uniref:uncharacterized protein n=1 Tax=Phyllosticta citriasiana TaxID=595635 RepID=UPI0030FDC458